MLEPVREGVTELVMVLEFVTDEVPVLLAVEVGELVRVGADDCVLVLVPV